MTSKKDDRSLLKKISPASSTRPDEEELLRDSEKLLQRVLTLDPHDRTELAQDFEYDESLAPNELEKLSRKAEEEMGLDLDPELLAMHKEADKAIKNCCIKVGIAMMSANAALLLPGVGEIIAMILGAAAAAGLVVKLQSDLVKELAEIFHTSVSETQIETIVTPLSGQPGAGIAGTKAVGFIAQKEINVVGKAVATTTKRKFARFVPLLGPLIGASIAVTTTYVIGKRSKVFFTKKIQQQRKNENIDLDEIVIKNWDEVGQVISETEQRIILIHMKEAVKSSVNNMKEAAVELKSYTATKGKGTATRVASWTIKNTGKAVATTAEALPPKEEVLKWTKKTAGKAVATASDALPPKEEAIDWTKKTTGKAVAKASDALPPKEEVISWTKKTIGKAVATASDALPPKEEAINWAKETTGKVVTKASDALPPKEEVIHWAKKTTEKVVATASNMLHKPTKEDEKSNTNI